LWAGPGRGAESAGTLAGQRTQSTITAAGLASGMFDCVEIPTPFAVGTVNTYVAGRTLVDPGPDSEEAWAALLDALEARSMGPADVEQVLITHPHPDHFGTAARLRAEGARIVASAPAAAIMADWTGRMEYEQEYFSTFFERCGLSSDGARAVTQLPEAFLSYAPSVETDREVGTDDAIEVEGVTVEVREVEGHAPGELLFAYGDGEDRVALVGDNVLEEITPNPLLQPPPEAGGERPRVLPAYNASLRDLREQGFDRFLPGHRGVITDPAGRIGETLTEHEERSERVLGMLDGPTTPVEVSRELFGELPATEVFSGMSEAVGHLDVLEARGEATHRDQGGVVVYERTD